MKIHPHDQTLAEFSAALDQGLSSSLLDHLADCRRCRERILVLMHRPQALPARMAAILPWPAPPAVDYGPALDAAECSLLVRAQTLVAERAEAPGRLAELMAHPEERREMLMRNHPRFQTWGLLECLTENVRSQSFQSPRAAQDLARLALALTDFLDSEYYGAERIEDLKGRLWGFVGNARRVASDLPGSEAAFSTAAGYLRKGTGDPLERALLLDLRSSLLRDLRRFDAAGHFLLRALRVYRDVGETHRAGRVLIKLATLYEHAGTPELAVPVLQEALTLIDAGREPRLLLSAQHNLITNLAEAGRFMEAHGLFIQARPVYARFPDAWTQNRRHWVAGKIARGLGQEREAEAHLRAAREGFAGESSPFDTALVALDLASLYAAQGRTTELEGLARGVLAVFSAGRIHREALAALSFLHQAAAAERASLQVVASVAGYLKRLRHDPELPFRAPEAQ